MRIRAACLFIASFWVTPLGLAQQVSTLKVSDSVDVRISGVPEADMAAISSRYTIGEDGKIPLAYLGRISAAGLTPSQLGMRIEEAYKSGDIFSSPTLAISADAKGEQGRLITVIGEVKAAQQTAFRDGMSLLDAIAAAGGFTDWADKRRIRLVRANQTTEHDFTQLLQDPTVNVTLRPADKVIVIHR